MAQADEFNYLYAKTAWMSSGKYLLLLKKLIESNNALERGNLDETMTEGSYAVYAQGQEAPPAGYFDARALIPFIYTLYNSVEQLLLAQYYAGFPHDRLKFVPTYTRLLSKYTEYGLSSDEVIAHFIEKYSYDEQLPSLLRGLLDASGYKVSSLQEARRALENNSMFNVLDSYQPYYYSVEEGIAFFSEVYTDVDKVLKRVNRLIADIDDDGNVGTIVKSHMADRG